MKIAIQNPFTEPFFAETELSRRIYQAAINLGWTAAEVHTATDIKLFKPDFVIALHNNSPKLAEYPTYGCLWNPPSFFQGTQKFVKHIFSYDGYLTSSNEVERWLHQLLYTTPKPCLTAPFYTSCPQTIYRPPTLETPHLVYLGSNWDGPRFQALFEGLDRQDYMEVYGNPSGWHHLQSSYKSALPYDGWSVLKTLNQAGVGLCLHRDEHVQAGLPSMRIFEIVAAGAIAICGEHSFIRAAFGDTVLYLDTTLDIPSQINQISSYMAWIRHHPASALAMAEAAHQIFLNHYTLEKLLSGILPLHEQVIEKKHLHHSPTVASLIVAERPKLQIIFPIVDQDCESVQSMLDMVGHQTCRELEIIVIKPDNVLLEEPLTLYVDQVSIQSITVPQNALSSTALWAGLNRATADYIAVLQPHTRLYPNHFSQLITLLDTHPDAGVAYAGALSVYPPQDPPAVSESATATAIPLVELGPFEGFDLDHLLLFEPCTHLSGLVARRSLLDSILLTDPQLKAHADLCLLLHLAQRTSFLFSYDVTWEIHRDRPPIAYERLQESRQWDSEIARLKFIFWHQEFAPGKSLQRVHHAYWEQQRLQAKLDDHQRLIPQLETAEATIAAMKTSKFWQLRTAWFKLKRAIGLKNDE